MENERRDPVYESENLETTGELVELDVITFPYLLEEGRAEMIGDTHGLMNTPSNRDSEWVKVEDGVIQVGNRDSRTEHTFNGCKELVNVELPDSVRIIDERAFEDCGALRDIKMSKNILFIGNFAFSECVNLESIDLYPSIAFIHLYAFSGCVALKEVRFHGTVEEYHKKRFDPEVFEEGVTILCDDNKKIQF